MSDRQWDFEFSNGIEEKLLTEIEQIEKYKEVKQKVHKTKRGKGIVARINKKNSDIKNKN
jgi:hypothetical protein